MQLPELVNYKLRHDFSATKLAIEQYYKLIDLHVGKSEVEVKMEWWVSAFDV